MHENELKLKAGTGMCGGSVAPVVKKLPAKKRGR